MLELVFAPAAQWISRSDDDIIQGTAIDCTSPYLLYVTLPRLSLDLQLKLHASLVELSGVVSMLPQFKAAELSML